MNEYIEITEEPIDKKLLIEFTSEYEFKSLSSIVPEFKKKYVNVNGNSFFMKQNVYRDMVSSPIYAYLKNNDNKKKPSEIGTIEMTETSDGTKYSVELDIEHSIYAKDIKDGLEKVLFLKDAPTKKHNSQAYSSQGFINLYEY